MCLAALRGEKVPDAATSAEDVHTLSYPVKLCILRGIRHHDGFGTELLHTTQTGPEHACFRRALNARAIMSNRIPDMDVVNDPDSVPYCIWYPDVAREDTYWDLARRYPQMRYQVGRACAVAGYSALYRELNLLPDISTAEEAQDSVMRGQRKDRGAGHGGSAEIFQHIVEQPVRWRVMDDYTKTVEIDNPQPARNYGLNGDTAVVSTLHLKRSFQLIRNQDFRFSEDRSRLAARAGIYYEVAPSYFNITEDWNIDEYTCTDDDEDDHRPNRPSSEAMLELLWSPLPFDLPWGDKDLLILMAAYHGDVDRYARLRRPHYVSRTERHCLVRGIYHNTAFARWCSIHLTGAAGSRLTTAAITARFIMSNDLSRVSDAGVDDSNDNNDKQHDLPRQIWYPQLAAESTYRELVLRQPRAMLGPVAHACVIAGYRALWDELVVVGDRVEPYQELVEECRVSHDRHYLDSLRESCARRGIIDADDADADGPDVWGRPSPQGPFTAIAQQVWNIRTVLVGTPRVDHVECDNTIEDEPTMYDGLRVRVPVMDLFIAGSGSKEARPLKKTSEEGEGKEVFDNVSLEELYLERRLPGGGEELDAYRRRGERVSRRGRRNPLARGRGGRWVGRFT